MEETMVDAGRRPFGRLFYWLMVTVMVTGSGLMANGAGPVPQTGPATATVAEVRTHDYGWGAANDRNLLGRFTTETFSLPRLARTQNYFMRLYDNSSPPSYLRYAAALPVDYPL
jgi:hypothetical protein